nr:sigma-70 family RNA polymerase sigma factor [Bacillus cereus]
MNMDIAYLVKQARKGNDQAFEQLITFVRQKLYRTAYSYVRNEQDALDIYQETIYEAYLSLRKLKEPEKFQSWITKILVFKAIDFIRKSSKEFVVNDEIFANLSAEENMNKLEQSLDLTTAFNFLDPTYKTIILLRYYHDLSIKEIADVLNSPEGTIKSQLHRAKHALRPILKEGYSYE